MPRLGPRHRLAKNVYEDSSGVSVVVQVHGVQRESRFPPGTDLEHLKRQRDELRAALHDAHPATARGTLAHDAERYLQQIGGLAGFTSIRSRVRAWVDRLGPKPRSRITAEDVRLAFSDWRVAGRWNVGPGPRRPIHAPASEKTLRERWSALRCVYRLLDGPRAKTPCDDVPQPRAPAPTPVGVPSSTIRRVVRSLKAATKGTSRTSRARQDYARFLLLVSTGQRPAQVRRAQREDFRLDTGTWIVRGAKGGPSHAVWLNVEMRAAVRAFLSAEAFGPWSSSRFARLLRRHGWPEHVRPYAARHSVAIDALERGADIGDVQALLGHTHIDTTRKFYAPIAAARQQRIARQLEGRLRIG